MKNLLVIVHNYTDFTKDQTEELSKYFDNVVVCVRVNILLKLLGYLPFKMFKGYYWHIDLENLPKNVTVYPNYIFYLSIKNIGDRHLKSVDRVVKKTSLQFDIIHSHFSWSAGYVGAKLKEKYSLPFIVTAHGYDIYDLPFKNALWKKNIEYVLNTANAIITVSQSNYECIKKLDVDTPVHVIPNGFTNDLFFPRSLEECRQQLNLPLDKKIIITVGYLEVIKGHRYLINAMAELIKSRQDVICYIIGNGSLRNDLYRQIKTLNLENYVYLVGEKHHQEIPCWMNACDLFVFPSIRESFGVVQIEAMACGKPVVATINGGSEEIVNTSNKYGLLVEPTDPEDLAEKIIMGLEWEWDREKILAYAERFTWENIVKEILTIYQGVGIWTERDLDKGE